jgi:hypothetical protein
MGDGYGSFMGSMASAMQDGVKQYGMIDMEGGNFGMGGGMADGIGGGRGEASSNNTHIPMHEQE